MGKITTTSFQKYWGINIMNFEVTLNNIIRNNLPIIFENLELKDEMELINDLNFDSITLMQLILDIEAEFNIFFDENTLYEDITNIGLLKSYIKRKINEKDS